MTFSSEAEQPVPTVSIVVPSYNVQATIRETLESVFAQTYADFEVIVINDGSTDRTLEVVAEFTDPRLRVYSYENGGLPVARNRGIDRARGRYLTFLDADDLWTPDKVADQVAALDAHPRAGAVYSWTSFLQSDGQALSPDAPVYHEGNVYAALLQGNFINSGSNAMLRREAIAAAGYFDADLKSIEDWDYWLRVAKDWEFALVPKHQVLYRQSATSMAAKVDVMEHYSVLVINRAYAAAPPELQHLKPQTLANTYQYLARMCITHASDRQKLATAARYLKKAVRTSPQILGDRKAQKTMAKWLVLSATPRRLSNYLVNRLGSMRAIDPTADPADP